MGALANYLTFLWVPGEETLVSGVLKLEPGHYLLWEQGRVTVKPWFELSYEPEHGRTEARWVDEVKSTVLGATRRQLVADVPLGAFLSGGLDSSSLVASMRQVFPTGRFAHTPPDQRLVTSQLSRALTTILTPCV
ncbi:MAG: hypothetical protein IPF84_04190 [Proteobacteria bacterium]|nr:hypothetical protein [Pseudomonadota bacterium]